MRKMVWSLMKFIIVFVSCTILFYFAIQSFHKQYESYIQEPLAENKLLKIWEEKKQTIQLF